MTKNDKRFSIAEDDVESWDEPTQSTKNIMRKVMPLGMRVLVRILPESNRTEAGLYLPEGTKQASQESLMAKVIEVASALDDDTQEETNISGIPEGAIVLIPSKAGTIVPWEDQLRIVETKEVLAIVHEVGLN